MAEASRSPLPLVVLLLLATAWPARANILHGSAIRCQHEGRELNIRGISDDPCITCKCLRSEVVCEKETCPAESTGCYLVEYSGNPRRTCCGTCRGCRYNGRSYPNGFEWPDASDPCTKFVCQSGVVTVSKIHCHVPCPNPIPPLPGQCCSTCPGCRHEGRSYAEGEVIPTRDGPCLKCRCENGAVTCSKQACPVLPCPPAKFAQRPDQCCPTCRGTSRAVPLQSKCTLGMHTYKDGASFSYDQCTRCSCNGTTSVCIRQVCPPLPCPPSHWVMDPEACCAECRRPEEHRAACIHKGHHYKSGSTWKLDKCTTCRCKDGQVLCAVDICPRSGPCPPRHVARTVAGDCCPVCIEDDGVCTVFGDPHYRTFDGKMFNFHGPCKYTLAQDCRGRTFSILVTNEARHSKHFAWTKSVIVKVDGTRVMLGQHWTVRVGRRRVRLPYIKLGSLSIHQEDVYIVARFNLGVKVLWDGDSYVEVSIPPHYRNQTCGLCGNFNGDPNDDFTTKKGVRLNDPDEFGNSWKTGKKKRCPTMLPSSKKECHQTWEGRLRAIRECNVLKAQAFRPCHTTVPALPYFNACLQDICECRPPGKRCHCEALTAYSRECKRAGVTISSEWRNITGCQGGHCPKGALFTKCGAACRRTCAHRLVHDQKPCHRKCRPGCQCPAGTVWHRARCIAPEQCPQS